MLFWIAAGLAGFAIMFVLYCCIRVGAQADRDWQEMLQRHRQQK